MARIFMVNANTIAGPIPIRVGEPIVLMLLFSLDFNDAIGDKWSAAAMSGGLTFTPTDVSIPAGAVSPVSIRLEATGGFAQPGAHQVAIFKIVGHGANPAIPALTIDFQVTVAPAQPVIAQPQPVAQPQPAPAAAANTTPAATIPQPFQVQVVAGTTPPNSNWLRGLSIASVCLAAIVLLFLLAISWILVDTMRLSNSSYTPPPEKSTQSSK